MYSRRGRIPKNLGFGGVLWVLPAAAGRKCPAVGIGGRRGITDCHSQCAHWLRNDTFFARGTVGSGRQGEGTSLYGNVSRSAVSGASGKSAKRCQWQMKRAGFEEVPRLADTTVTGNRLARRWATAGPYECGARPGGRGRTPPLRKRYKKVRCGKESPSHGFAVPAPFRQGSRGDGGCGLPRPVCELVSQ